MKNRSWMVLAIALLFAACTSVDSDKPDFEHLDQQALKVQRSIYLTCVVEKIKQLNDGSPDVKLIVDTAMNACSMDAIYAIYTAANFKGPMAILLFAQNRAVVRTTLTEALLAYRANAAHKPGTNLTP
jgi:hypothetical protein